MTRRPGALASVVVVVVVVVAGITAPASAQPSLAPDPNTAIAQANAAATVGDWARVAGLIAPLLPGAALARSDRAEVHRLAGLAAFFTGERADAERELLAYMRLELDARLDPSLVPPEAITFFEGVRARHGAELRALGPRPRRYAALNLLPPAGQVQNGHTTKAIVVGGGLAALVAANVTTYFVLRSWCGGDHGLCEVDGSDRAHSARVLKTVNVATGAAAVVLYLYGVVDGVRYYRLRGRELRLEASEHGGAIVFSSRF